MHRIIKISCAVALLASAAVAADGPEIQNIDGKITMQAESVPLARLLRLLDSATGMSSRVPPELANRNVSVRFSGLSFDAAVRKLFEGQPLDYIVISGKGIMVTAVAQATASGTSPSPSAFAQQPPFPGQQGFGQDGVASEFPVFNQQPQQGVTQTPFGPIPGQPQPVQPVPGTAVTPQQPGAASPFGTLNPFGTNPFGGPSPNTTNPTTPATPLFGNTAPVPFQQNPAPK